MINLNLKRKFNENLYFYALDKLWNFYFINLTSLKNFKSMAGIVGYLDFSNLLWITLIQEMLYLLTWYIDFGILLQIIGIFIDKL